MICVHVHRDSQNNVISYRIQGHANASEYGKDIVCASISVLGQTAILALYELLSIDIVYEIEQGSLYCELPNYLPDAIRNKANIILDTMLIGIKATQEIYREYIELFDEEV